MLYMLQKHVYTRERAYNQHTHKSHTAMSLSAQSALRPYHAALAVGLGTTDPCSIAVDMEPLSEPHSSRVFTRVLATTTKICTTGGSSQTHVKAFCAHRHAFLLVGASRLLV